VHRRALEGQLDAVVGEQLLDVLDAAPPGGGEA
jgi:hypothetical protein